MEVSGGKGNALGASWGFMEETEVLEWFGEKFGEKCINEYVVWCVRWKGG